MRFTVSADQPPPYYRMMYWERSVDPFNPGLLAEAARAEGLTIDVKAEKPHQGWLGIEWGENPVGFIRDGYVFDAEEAPAYIINDLGPSGHRIAERALTSLENARWYQSHSNLLVLFDYSSQAVIERTALIDCRAIIMHEDDVAKFVAEFETVQYKYHEIGPAPNINSKPLFIAPRVTPKDKREVVKEGEFIVVMKRHGLKPKGTVSEFE